MQVLECRVTERSRHTMREVLNKMKKKYPRNQNLNVLQPLLKFFLVDKIHK